jgi:hypothetical protein
LVALFAIVTVGAIVVIIVVAAPRAIIALVWSRAIIVLILPGTIVDFPMATVITIIVGMLVLPRRWLG